MSFLPPLDFFITRLLYFCDAIFRIFLQPTEILKKSNAEILQDMKFKQLSLQKMRLALKTVKALLYRFILPQ